MSDEIELDNHIKVGCVIGTLSECINKKLFGEVLTIIDASYSDNQAKKAIKSLISQSFTRNTDKIISELRKLSVSRK